MSIFLKAVNIRELEFTDGVDWTSNPIWEPVKTAISNMSLTRLSLRIISESAEVVPQLQAQPGLEHLELWTAARLWDLKETDIPRLRSLSATLQDAATIVPGRPVEELHLALGLREHRLDEQLVQKLSLSSGPITKLVTRLRCPQGQDVVRHTLQVLAHHLPQLRHLTLDVGGVLSGRVLLDEIPAFRFLRSVKFLNADLHHPSDSGDDASRDASGALAGLDNSGDDRIVAQIPEFDDWKDLVQRLGEKCPLLVDIAYMPLPHCCCSSCVARALG
ncbi:hypothetical protein M407DRAFT_21558 [Tulasnella calospora MUT 4182]|uniref:Uncharacterized protein n=1 Tax=Tulasnella calospora MUT 4182 TaxID=1051891 RepID=A0A0C3M6T7_9AGAM|nr:hypothetical protein M407DRAFT_21558 [Tulasnella calospora MUT 4182]